MKYLLTTIICVAFTLTIQAQEFKFGKISEDELSQTQHPLDSSANAAVLYKNENIFFYFAGDKGFEQHREVYKRIKIYNKEGYDWATEKILLYKGGAGSKERVSSIKGYTYNLENGKIKKDKLKKEGVFEEEANEFIEINTITMPNIQDGCVIEYKYEIVSPFLAIDDIFFQYEIPMDKFDFRVATPQYYRYNKQINPKAFYYPNLIESTGSGTANYVNKKDYGAKGVNPARTASTGSFDYKEQVIKAEEVNIPALKGEAFAGNMDNYRSKMSMELAAILNSYGAVDKSFSANWETVSKSIFEDSDFGNQLNRSGFFKDDIAAIAAAAENDFQKAFLLQTFVKSKVKWNGLYGFRAQKGTRKAYMEGEGNVADINLLLVAMLRSQGVNANPVLISTRNNGIPIFPTRKGFNYVICMVESEDSYALLDATEVYSMVNVLPSRVLNWQGRVIKDDGTSGWVSLRPTGKSSESYSLNVKINDDFTINGKVRQNVTEHLALSYRNRFSDVSNEEHVKALEKDNGDIEITELSFETDSDITQPVRLSYDYLLRDGVDEIGDNLYISPMLFLATKENPFKLEERQYPIDFAFPFEDKYMINIMMPEGYQIESLPESEIMEFKNSDAKFTYMIKENGNFLQLNIILEMNSSFINPEDYKVFKDFFGKIIEKQSEQVVLKKV